MKRTGSILLGTIGIWSAAFAQSPPSLNVTRSAGQMVLLSWTASNAAWQVEQSLRAGATNWTATPVPAFFDSTNGAYKLLAPATNARSFYRLSSPGVGISLGAPRQIFHFGQADAMGLFNVPDMHTALLQQSNSYLLWITGNIGTNAGSVAMLTTTDFVSYANAGPGTSTAAQPVFTPSCSGASSCVANIDADYAGANAVITAANGQDLLMFYEAGNKTFGTNTVSGLEYNVIALARSSDHGLSWTRYGAVLAGPEAKPTTTSGTTQPGISEPGLLAANGYLYMFFQYIPNEPTEADAPAVIQVARAPVSSDGMPGSWLKLYQGAWSEPG